MAENFVDGQVDFLLSQYPTMSSYDAYCLVISGYGEIQQDNPTAYQAILDFYDVTNQDVVNTNNNYRSGTGTPCSN